MSLKNVIRLISLHVRRLTLSVLGIDETVYRFDPRDIKEVVESVREINKGNLIIEMWEVDCGRGTS